MIDVFCCVWFIALTPLFLNWQVFCTLITDTVIRLRNIGKSCVEISQYTTRRHSWWWRHCLPATAEILVITVSENSDWDPRVSCVCICKYRVYLLRMLCREWALHCWLAYRPCTGCTRLSSQAWCTTYSVRRGTCPWERWLSLRWWLVPSSHDWCQVRGLMHGVFISAV